MKNIHKKYKIWNEPKKTLTTRLKGHENQNNRRNKPQNKHSFNKKVSNKKSNISKNNSKIRSLEQKMISFLSYKTRSATPLTFYRCCVAVITLFCMSSIKKLLYKQDLQKAIKTRLAGFIRLANDQIAALTAPKILLEDWKLPLELKAKAGEMTKT